MSNLDFPAAVGEISEAAAHLKAEGSPSVGVVGFCMGGALAMGALAASADLSCGAPFYGVNFGLFDIPKQLVSKPVQGHFGELDNLVGFSDAPTGRKLEAELKAKNWPPPDSAAWSPSSPVAAEEAVGVEEWVWLGPDTKRSDGQKHI